MINLYYDSGILKYEGDGDIRHGKGKSYHTNGNLKYDGNFSNGYGQGQGKFYYKTGELNYDS